MLKNDYPGTSKMLVYLSEKIIEGEGAQLLISQLNSFLGQWKAHGQQLEASCTILHGHFLVVIINTNVAIPSGCSLDALVNALKQIGTSFKVDFFKNSNVAFREAGKISVVNLKELKTAVDNGVIKDHTEIFVPVETLTELNEKWVLPAHKTWVARYLKKKDLV